MFKKQPTKPSPSQVTSPVPALSHLGLLRKGEWAVVTGLVECSDEGEYRAIQLRLLELGFVPGEKVRVIAESFPQGDPIAVRVGNSTFALRRHEASMIQVSCHEPEAIVASASSLKLA